MRSVASAFPACINLVGTASGTAPRRGASARQVGGVASAPPTPVLFQIAGGQWRLQRPLSMKALEGEGGAPGPWEHGLGAPGLQARARIGWGDQGGMGVLQRTRGIPGEARLPTALSGLKLLERCWCLDLGLI